MALAASTPSDISPSALIGVQRSAGVVVLAVMVIAFTLRKVVAAKSGEDEED